jgi:tetratricopeptide (TPR) repeat protein
MRLRSTFIIGLLLSLLPQSPQDAIRRHYQAAEAARNAGNIEAAESEYASILGEGYHRLGRIYSARSEYQLALTVLKPAETYGRASAELLVDLAIAYFGAQKYEEALAPANAAIALAPNNAGAHQMLGKTYFMLADMSRAISELETAARLAPNDIDTAYTLGIAYLRNRQPTEAKRIYNSLIKTLGAQPQLHVIIGRAYRQSGLLADAIEEFQKAIALDPGFPRAHYYLGITYLLDEDQAKLPEALAEFKIEVAANPNEFFGNYYLGVVYNFQRQWDQAIPFLQKAVSLQPNNPDPYFQLSQAYQELNRHDRAIEVLRKTIALNPYLAHNKGQVTTAHHRLAQSLIKIGQTEAGNKELQIASDLKAQAFKLEQEQQQGISGMIKTGDRDLLEPGSDDQNRLRSNDLSEAIKRDLQASEAYYKKVIGTAHNNIGLLRAERQDFLAAAEQFALAAKWDPEVEGLHYNSGLAFYKAQSYKQAARHLDTELKTRPQNRPAAILLGLTLFRLEDFSRASELLSASVDPESKDIDLHYALASALIRVRKTEASDQVIKRIRTIRAEGPHLELLLAEKYYADGAEAKALAHLAGVASSDSNSPMLRYYAGLLYLKLNKRDEAVKEWERQLVANPNDTATKYALGEVLIAGANADRGLALIREVVQLRPDHAEARFALGKALLRSKNMDGAIDHLQRVVKLEPEWADAHYQLGQAYLAAGRKAEGKSEIEISKQLRSRKPNNNQ